MSRFIQGIRDNEGRVTVHPEKSVPRTAGYSDAVSVLAQDRPSLAIVSGQGGAAGQRERVAELVMMAREQGREVQIIAADRRSQMNLKQDERLSGELITGRRQLLEGMAFTPGSTVIVDQGEKLSLKETLTLLDGAARHNVQVLISGHDHASGGSYSGWCLSGMLMWLSLSGVRSVLLQQ